jgi:uncharacterized membrane protein
LVFFPLTKKIFHRFSFDLGYPFAKVLAIVFVTYATYVLGTIKILTFDRMSLFLIVGIFVLINFFLLKNRKALLTRYLPAGRQGTLYVIFLEEFLFLSSFLFWTFIRSQEPSIHGLEKFMDFGFMNSILKSQFFPPLDIWYTPLPINYYYFGHLSGALLIRLTNISASIGYNLILSTIFALAITQIFSLITNIILIYNEKIKKFALIIYGLIGAYIVNFAANLHPIYLFTSGYPNENPIPFWKILSGYNPIKYWYPNATRFIPLTIHEFPSYSYVVADLHGHVFDIPFIILTVSLLFLFFTSKKTLDAKYWIPNALFLGFLTAVHYMTNAFDGPIYLLLTIFVFYFVYKFTSQFAINTLILIITFVIFSLPFSSHFTPFISGIGLNCSPDFLVQIGRIGPFIFEKDKCQASPLWMLFVLWGFFWISFILFSIFRNSLKNNQLTKQLNNFFLILFSFGTFLVLIPEFFYIKDIYPAHFRANTMFKLGYQAFIMMGISSTITFFVIKSLKRSLLSLSMTALWIFFFFFVSLYPFFSIPSYYGFLNRSPNLNGTTWLKTDRPEDKEIIEYLNQKEKGQPVILEAQGDSYTDYERISAFTGLPTVAGWWVHEWLWRGSSNIIGNRIPEVVKLYQSKDLDETIQLIKKYKIKYVIVSKLEREKYLELQEAKFTKIGRLIFRSSNGLGAIYQIN